MSTDLEKYIFENREAMDIESPDDILIWEGISKELHGERMGKNHKGRKVFLIRIRNIAATILILFSFGYILNDILSERIFSRKITLSAIDEELGRREQEYKTLVSFKRNEVRSLSNTDNIIIRELFEEIDRLDLIYEQSMKDLVEMGNDEQVINTIFDTYEKKIHLFELIILETNKISNYENNEKVNL